MNFSLAARPAAAGLAFVVAAHAGATMFSWSFLKGQAPQNTAGGTIESINATYDSATKRLTFDALLSGANAGSPAITRGFTLVIDNGPDPKGRPGELAIFYFDASVLAAPKLSVYGYNGQNANTSWLDGSASQPGLQSPDLIKGVYDTSYIHSISATDVEVFPGSPSPDSRRFRFDIDATDVNSHEPLHPETGPWKGAQFDTGVGIWFHPAGAFDAAYQTRSGGLPGRFTSLSTGSEGWLDISVHAIPAPECTAILGLAGVAAMRRRRT